MKWQKKTICKTDRVGGGKIRQVRNGSKKENGGWVKKELAENERKG